MVITGELGDFLNGASCSGEAIEHFLDTSSWLHRNNSELIFFVNPNKEGLGIIVEDASTRRPISVEIACTEETVSFPKDIK